MSTRYKDLADALKAELQTQLGSITALVIERRLTPRKDRTEFEDSKVYLSVYVGSGGWEILARQVDQQQWEIILGIQAAIPKADANASGNPFGAVTTLARDQVAWSDTVFEIIEKIKDLWRAESEDGSTPAGALRELSIAGCDTTKLVHDPIYIPDDLTELGILTSVITLTFRVVED